MLGFLQRAGRAGIAAFFVVGAVFPVSAEPGDVLAAAVARQEHNLNGRVGVMLLENGTGWSWGHRAGERFMMNSTFKPLLCGAILSRADEGALRLEDVVEFDAEDILDYAPVTRKHVASGMTLGALCKAALDKSDNTAANLLLEALGGPEAVTMFLRRIGDQVTRLDRMEPEVNIFIQGDPRDTTSPAAMVASWEKLLLGEVLSAGSRAQLKTWMEDGSVTKDLIRASLPEGWAIADKSGGGRDATRGIVAMISPPTARRYIVAIYVEGDGADWKSRNRAIAETGSAVIEAIKRRAAN